MKLSQALVVRGNKPLQGDIKVNTAKNSALFLMLGSLLTREEVVLRDIPKLSDILVMTKMLEHFGAKVSWIGSDLHICAADIINTNGPYHLVSKMRASFVAIGPLLGRCGEASMAMPGGCAWGPRPVDRHIKAFKALGAVITEEDGDFNIHVPQALSGIYEFEAPTVGGTENVLLASVLGEKTVVIRNAALEPEIIDLATMLNAMGAHITGAGTRTITIEGVSELHGVTYRPISDRIEAATLMLAIAAARSKAVLHDVDIHLLGASIDKLREAGVKIDDLGGNRLSVDATGELRPVNVMATEYPGIPTDVQAPFGAFLATLEGPSSVEERVYPGHRFTHVEELHKMGANIELEDSTLSIEGCKLTGAKLQAADIRAGGALIIAALAAEGTSVITGVQYIERGYENIAERLRGLGADIHLEEVLETAQTGTYGD